MAYGTLEEVEKLVCSCGNDNLRFENVLLNWEADGPARLEVHDRCFTCFKLHVSVYRVKVELVEHREERNFDQVIMGEH